jgi:pilus assembly protein FimV
VVEQYTEKQYDDDLTDSSGEYDDSYYTGAEDLFGYTPDEESPISRLKSLVLSIDWEITDDVLMEFNEELVDLKDIWAGEKINLVYVQALEKLSKYIYQKKADSHPSAIKLLLTLYQNLEKIVSSEDLSEAQKKEILLEDVKRFENLKSYLKTPDTKPTKIHVQPVIQDKISQQNHDSDSELLNLKAIVLGIDWEITDDDLSALRQEVVRLEKLYAGSRPRLILLQGIGTIGAYIKVKKSDSHADAFKVFHLFYESLEKLVDAPMGIEEEKAILFAAVEKFNAFKSLLGETISPESLKRSKKTNEGEELSAPAGVIAPAFSDIAEDEARGFQADEEAAALGIESPEKVNVHVANFFGEDSFTEEKATADQLAAELENQFGESGFEDENPVDKLTALEGVDVEEGDEDVESGSEIPSRRSKAEEVVPALFAEDRDDEETPIVAELSDEVMPPASSSSFDVGENDLESSVKVIFPDDEEDNITADFGEIDKEVALQGVDVESEADDDSDEEALPFVAGELAPALLDNDEVSIYNAKTLEKISADEGLKDEIAGTVLDFFEEDKTLDQETRASEETVAEEEFSLDEDLSFEPDSLETGDLSIEAPVFPAGDNLVDDEISSTPTSEISASHEKRDTGEDVTSAIEDQLDDFFGIDDAESDQSSGDLFAAIDFTEDEVVPPVELETEEEEVVFELVEELSFDDEFETTDTVAALSAFDDEAESSEVIATISDVGAPGIEGVLSADDNEIVSAGQNSFESLGTCIEAIGLELEDKVLDGLLSEIESAQQQCSGQPLEKTFLYLLKTVADHINHFRYESGSEAYVLLKSVYGVLLLSQTAVDERQDLLLAQTAKVLDWQQNIILNGGGKDIDHAASSSALFVQEIGSSSDEVISFDDDLFQADEENVGSVPTHFKKTAGELKEEISSLRKSLQDEISEMKKGLSDD